MSHGHTGPSLSGHVPGQHGRLLFERADLVVEHELAPGPLPAGVVDARHPAGVGQRPHDEPVVADGRAQDHERAGVDELGEGPLDVEGGARRQPVSVAGHQFEGAVESPGGGHLVEADPEGVLEQGPVVGLGEVVEDAHQDRCRRARRVGHGPPSNVSQRVRTTTLALAPRPTVWASATRAPATWL